MLFRLCFLLLAAFHANAEGGEHRPSVSADCASPTVLTCELLTEPLQTVIYDPRPEFGWICGTGAAGYLQSAYQVEVHAAPADSGRRGERVWDSGKVDGDQSVAVEYRGDELRPGESYTWRVRAWNAAGQASRWSQPQTFRMAAKLSESRVARYPLQTIPQHPERVSCDASGGQFVDFGKAAFGYVRLSLPERPESRNLVVRFGEKLNRGRIDRRPGGSIRYYAVRVSVPAGMTEITVRPPRDRRNTTGAAISIRREVGIVAPFRYLEIEGLDDPLAREGVQRIAVQYPFDEQASYFQCSNPTLNAVWDLSKYSIEATTFCGVYVDGDRERIPYEADAYLNQLSHYGVDREFALARHSHEYLLRHPTWPTEWKQHSVLIAWADYLHTGDTESLRNHYATLKKEKLLLAAELDDGLLDTSGEQYRDIVDWPEAERDGFEMTAVNTVVNAFHYATLVRMSEIARVVGIADDAQLFAEKAARCKERFNEAFWDADHRAYVDGAGSLHHSLHANLFPLAFDLVPPEREADVLKFVQSRGMRCSVYAAQYLLEGLYAHDCSQYALGLLTSRGKRSWYNMIRSGSTITLEAWDKQYKPNLDWNHAWGAAPANIVPFYLVGVRPVEPGHRKIVIQPRPSSLDYFSARVPTIRGPVDVNYQRIQDAMELTVTVPGNCVASVGLPLFGVKTPMHVQWNGQDTSLEIRGEHGWIEGVEPGIHKFRLFSLP